MVRTGAKHSGWSSAQVSVQKKDANLRHQAGNFRKLTLCERHLRLPLLGGSAGFGFFQCFENGFLRILERGKDVLGNFLNELVSPERVSHVVVNDANVMEVKGHIRLV